MEVIIKAMDGSGAIFTAADSDGNDCVCSKQFHDLRRCGYWEGNFLLLRLMMEYEWVLQYRAGTHNSPRSAKDMTLVSPTITWSRTLISKNASVVLRLAVIDSSALD